MKRNIVFIGPPGCGKGTQAHLLKDSMSLHHISTGAILRHEIQRNTPLGLQVKEIIDKGFLIEDDLMFDVLSSYLAHHSDESGFIFDGFPRTLNQAEWFDRFLSDKGQSLKCVIYFAIDEEILIKRLSGRFTCAACGATYNEYFKKPHQDSICDVCGSSEFSRRADDAVEHVTERLRAYHAQTKPLLPFYEKKGLVREINVMGSLEEISDEIRAAVDA